jgi:hypothetical protein
MKDLPYSTSQTDPFKAQSRIRNTLKKFGVNSISVSEDYEKHTIDISFQYKQYPVSIPIEYGKLAQMYIDADPYTSRKRMTREGWEESKREIAYSAAFSILEDYLKAVTIIIELGVRQFEDIFFTSFVNQNGVRIGDLLIDKLPKMLAYKEDKA